ncbi:MAG: hypothetical protein IT336_08690 [Thermomicrobiales bacterium]|nr:hypothetical protein [Thermomicrobiales bacterium]
MTSSTLAPGPNGHAEPEAAADEAERLTAASALIQAFLRDSDVQDASPWDVQPARYPAGKAICNAEPDRRAAAVVVGIYLHVNELRVSPCGHNAIVLRSLLLALLRRATPFRDSDLDAIFELLAGIPRLWAGHLPVLQLAKAIELHVAEHPLPVASHEALNELIASAEHEAVYADQKKGLDIFRRLAADHGRVAIPIDAVDDWGA